MAAKKTKPQRKKKRTPPYRTKAHSPTRAKQLAFLTAFAELGTVTHAAEAVPIDRHSHYDWLETDQWYSAAFGAAVEAFADKVRNAVRNRAIEGWQEPVVYQGALQVWRDKNGDPIRDRKGKLVPVTVTKFSDRLLELLAKGKCPEFREKHEITGPGGGPVTFQVITGVPQPEGQS